MEAPTCSVLRPVHLSVPFFDLQASFALLLLPKVTQKRGWVSGLHLQQRGNPCVNRMNGMVLLSLQEPLIKTTPTHEKITNAKRSRQQRSIEAPSWRKETRQLLKLASTLEECCSLTNKATDFNLVSLPVMAAVAVRKKVVSIGHFLPSFFLQSLQLFLFVRSNQKQLYVLINWKSEK